MSPQALPILSIPAEIHEEAKALGMDAEELWRQRQELAEWVEARASCHALADELPVSALTGRATTRWAPPTTHVLFCGQPVVITCDGRCDKAWGINLRPRRSDEEDAEFLSDDELGEAPRETGHWEGGEGKPLAPVRRHNKWCARECERSEMKDA